LREGLDLPEVSLIAILDADKEGFLRSTTSLIQIIGRAARNINGQVIMYADKITDSMQRAVAETNRRRTIQENYNTENGITPHSVKKEIRDVLDTIAGVAAAEGLSEQIQDELVANKIDHLREPELVRISVRIEKEMKEAARQLAFEEAARLRDLLVLIRGRISEARKL
jgi:excinuclease ABC subunit B